VADVVNKFLGAFLKPHVNTLVRACSGLVLTAACAVWGRGLTYVHTYLPTYIYTYIMHIVREQTDEAKRAEYKAALYEVTRKLNGDLVVS